MKNINKFLCILIFFCFIICLNCTYAVSDNAVENDTLSVDYQSDDIYSDSVDVSSDDNHVDEKIENSSDVKIQDNNAKPSNVVKKASSTVKTTITAKDVTKYYQDGTTLKAYLKNSNGKALSGKKITVTYSGKTYSRTTDSKGCVSWNVQKGPGTYSVKFSFSASGYASSSKTAKVTVKAMPTTLTANNLAFTYGDGNNKLKATLKDKNGKVLADKTVVFNFNGKNYNQKTDSKGVATLTIGAGPKKYTTTISFTNSNYVTSKKTVTVTVNSIPTSLTVNDLTCNYDDSNAYLYATLKDTKNNKFLSGQTITFKINDKSTNVVSDSNGRAGIKIEEKPGTYNVDVSFAKSPYASISKKINLNVQGALTPEINIQGGYYNTSSLLVDFTGDNAEYIVYCSFDNGASWYKDNHNLSFNLTTGNWSITYYSSFRGVNSTINHVNYVLDGDAPLVWASHGSGIYNNKFQVNLTSVDLFDENPTIYYTLDGSDPTVQSNIYSQPINVVKNTNLRFFAIDKFNHKSEIISVYYFIGNCIANLNNGKTYTTIQNAINDDKTKKGDVIEISKGTYQDNIVISKQITLLGNNGTVIIGALRINSKNVNIYDLSIYSDGFDSGIIVNEDNCSLYNCKIICKNSFSGISIFKSNFKLMDSSLTMKNQGYSLYMNSISNCIISNTKFDSVNGLYLNNVNSSIFKNNTFIKNQNTLNGINKLKLINCFDNIFQKNNLTCGLILNKSGNNIFSSNWIYDNLNFYLIQINSPGFTNKFYLNFIRNENNFRGIFISNGSDVDLSNNWWGCKDYLKYIKYENNKNKKEFPIIMLKSYISSYKTNNGFIYGVDICADLNYNSQNQDLSSLGKLPDGILINFNNGFINFSASTIKSKAKSYFMLNEHEITNFNVNSNDYLTKLSVNTTACIHINVFSRAMHEDEYLNFTYDVILDNPVHWVSLVYRSIGNFTSEVDLIVNGDIVKNFTVLNSYYYISKKYYHFSDNFFYGLQKYKEYKLNSIHEIEAECLAYLYLEKGLIDLNCKKIYEFGSFNISSDYWNNIKLRYNKTVESIFLELIQKYYNLTDDDMELIEKKYMFYEDDLKITIDYPGDIANKYSINNMKFQGLGNQIIRTSKITYIDGSYIHLDNKSSDYINGSKILINENSIKYSKGYDRCHFVESNYDGFLTFTFISKKVDDNILNYWLDEKNKTYSNGSLIYENGYMKAAYGSFLNGLLVFYCLDKVADVAGNLFNVTWNRSTPIAIGVWDNHYETTLSGQCNFRFGMDVNGSDDNIRSFNSMITSMFSPIEYWVMKALFPNNLPYSSVTLGLGSMLFDGFPIEIIMNEDLFLIRQNGSNNRVLIFDNETGCILDILQYQIQGAYCYSNQQAEWAWEFGKELLKYFDYLLNSTYECFKDVDDFIKNPEYCINSAFNNTFGFLDDYIDDTVLGIIGGVAISVGIGLLIANPVGLPLAVGLLLFGSGIIATYAADDLNKGWTIKRLAHFSFDVVTSSIPASSTARLGKVMVVGQETRYITKRSIDGFDKILLEYAKYNGGTVRQGSRAIVSYGTFGSALATAYGNRGKDIMHELYMHLIGEIIGIGIDNVNI